MLDIGSSGNRQVPIGKRFLFLPLEVGLAHITRSLAIAEQLASRGYESYVLISDKKRRLIKSTQVHLVELDASNDVTEDYSLLDKYQNADYLYDASKAEKAAIEKIRPDCVIVDYRLSGLVASIACGMKTVFICDGGWGPYDVLIPNPRMSKATFSIIKPFISFLFNRVKKNLIIAIEKAIRMYGLKSNKEAILNSIQFIVPEPYTYFPAINSLLNIKYTGPIFWKGFQNLHDREFDALQPDGRTIYLTFGGTAFDGDSMAAISSLLLQNGYRVVVTTSTITDKHGFKKDKNLFVFTFLDGEKVSKLVDLVVCHGGYGTMMQALLAKKPVLAIPYNFSQFVHALRFQELGLGECVIRSPAKSSMNLLTYNWRQFEQDAKRTKPEAVVKTVQAMMKNYNKYINQINNFFNTIPNDSGEIKAADVILQFISKNQ